MHLGVGAVHRRGVIGAALWLWMAQKCLAGKGWARMVSTVFFGIETLGCCSAVSRRHAAGLSSFYNILVWLIGLTAVILLWRRASSDYFRANRRY